MFRLGKNKQAYLAVLIILLCLISLTGATYALFTSNINDGTIGIITTAADLNVDIVDTAGETLQGKALTFVTTAGAADSSKVLFEPGAVFYTQGFKVKNEGNVPVNFKLSVSKDDRIDGEEFDKAFTGICLMVTPGEKFVPSGKPKSVWKFARSRLIHICYFVMCIS